MKRRRTGQLAAALCGWRGGSGGTSMDPSLPKLCAGSNAAGAVPDCFASRAMTAKIWPGIEGCGRMRGGFGESLKRLGCAALLALACTWPAAADEVVIKLTVDADPVKANGSPWDGYPAVGGRIVAP